MKVKVVFDETSQMTWVIRMVLPTEKYGRSFALTNDEPEPLVEFYDARFGHTDLGQLVSRYYMSTLLAHQGGLLLDGGVPAWRINAAAMDAVLSWLRHTFPQVEPATLQL